MKKLLIYTYLFILPWTLSAGFKELHFSPRENLVEVQEAISGKDYICYLKLKKKAVAVEAVKSNCACVEILKVPVLNEVKHESVLLFKPVRKGPFLIQLTISYKDKSIEKIHLKGEVTGGSTKGNLIPSFLLKRESKSVNAKFYVSAKQAMVDKSGVIIDLRSKKQFDSFFIPGSKNLQPFAVRTQDWLLKKKIYLIDDGLYKNSLEALCEKLRASGFKKAYIVQGGITSWLNSGGKFNREVRKSELSSVPASAILQSKNFKQVVFVNDCKNKDDLNQLIPFTVSSQNLKLNSSLQYVWITDKKSSPIYRSNIFHIQGGLSGLKKFLSSYSAALSKGSIITKRKNCGNCPK